MIKCLKNERGTFLLDAFLLLPACGLIIVYLATRHLYRLLGRKEYIIPVLALFTLLGFWIVAGGLYLDRWKLGFLSGLSGNDFMWNWPFNLMGIRLVSGIPTYLDLFGLRNLSALFFFCAVYPISLWIGIQTGYIMFGRSERQRGVASFLFPPKKSHFKA